MIHLKWLLAEIRSRLGWEGIVGIALILGCGAFYANVIAPLDSRLTDNPIEAGSARRQQREIARMALEQDPTTQLESFYLFFGKAAKPTEVLGTLYGIAEANGLKMRQAEYRMGDASAGRLAQYQIVIPLTGTYPQIKHFVSSILAEIPIASLDQFSMQRRKIGDRTVDAQLQLTLFVPERS